MKESNAKQKARYRSSIRSQQMIRNAFIELLKEKDFSKITVTDIVNRANLNRTTFYAHYPDIHGVIEEFENEIIAHLKDVLNDIRYDTFFQDPVPIFLKTNAYFEENLELYRAMFLSGNPNHLFEKFKDILVNYMRSSSGIPEEIRSSEPFEIRICFFAAGIIVLYAQWFKGELSISLDMLALELGKIVASFSTGLL